MEEEESSEYTIEKSNQIDTRQDITVKDGNGDVVMRHEMFMVDSYPVIYSFKEKNPDFDSTKYPELEKYKMFVDTLGAPPYYLILNIPEEIRNSKLRSNLLLEAESFFYNLRKESYLRYIHDFGCDNWYCKHIDEYINKLNSMGIPASILIDGDRSGWERYEAILLFKKEDNPS